MKTTHQLIKPLFTTLCLLTFLATHSTQAKNPTEYAESVPKPTLTGIKYGEHHRNIIDFWQAPSNKPTPLVLVIHGGGWNGNSMKSITSYVETQTLLKAGISVAAINYRYIKHSKDLKPPVTGPLFDAARALQFIRSKATEWNIDKSRIAATGGSAGGCSSLWLAYHDDLADPENKDLIKHESTRLTCVAVLSAQTTLDPKQMKEWITNSKYGGHAFGKKNFTEFLIDRENILPWIKEYSPYNLLSKDDPPTYLIYDKAPSKNKIEKDPTHSSIFGVELQKHCKSLKVPCELVYPASKGMKQKAVTKYLIKGLQSKK